MDWQERLANSLLYIGLAIPMALLYWAMLSGGVSGLGGPYDGTRYVTFYYRMANGETIDKNWHEPRSRCIVFDSSSNHWSIAPPTSVLYQFCHH